MKKFIYILILVVVATITISSCTEQEIKPAAKNGGANSEDVGR